MSNDTLVREATHFLEVLEERVAELSSASAVLDEDAAEVRFSEYQQFRDVMAGCLTFTIIIQNRIERIGLTDPETAERLKKSLDILTIRIWSILLTGALHFFQVISQNDTLPIGTRDVFTRELRTLHDASKIFRDPRYIDLADEKMARSTEVAEKILLQIIEKAPSLLDVNV